MGRTGKSHREIEMPPIEEICNLPREERENRIAAFRRDVLPLATKRRDCADGMTLDFEYTTALERQLEEWVAFERVCCSDLTWDLSHSRPNRLSLTVSGTRSNSRCSSP